MRGGQMLGRERQLSLRARSSAGRPQGFVAFAAMLLLAVNVVPAGPSWAAPSAEVSKTGAEKFDARDLTGVWHITNFHPRSEPIDNRITRTIEGDPVPLLPQAQALYDKRIADARAGVAFADNETYCITSGMPRMMRGPAYPFMILQPPGIVVMLFEVLHNVRWIYMDQAHTDPDDLVSTYQGDSTAKWEGDTLVVDTIGFNDKTTIDKLGLPHSDQMHVVEHIRRTGVDAFENRITIEDPKTFSRPFTVLATYERMPPGTHIMENICDNNRNTPDANGRVTLQEQK